MIDGGSIKGQAKWNIIYDAGSLRESMGDVSNCRVRGGETWSCLDPAGIPARAWYRIPLRIKLDTEPPITYFIIDLAQAREVWRFHDGLSTPMYEKM